MQELHMIAAPLTKGIKAVCFSNDGKYLAAVAVDDEHMIAVYDLLAKRKTGQALAPIAHGKGSRNVLFSLIFDPTNKTLVSAGVKCVNFHTGFETGALTTKVGSGWGVGAAQGP